jgi:DNA-binding response OmpR family regulator
MPKMDGFELCRQLKKVDSKVKVCFITAFDVPKGDVKTGSTILDNNNDYNDKHIIKKPISIHDLVNRVKAELS